MKRLAMAAVFATFTTSAVAADLNICVEGAYPPFSEINSSGEIVGFDIDIANALCEEMGKSCAMVQSEWDGIIPALLEGKCDAIIASMSITEERKQRVDFSDKYYNSPGRFVARADAGLTDTPEGLADKVVGLQRGTIFQDYMEAEMPDVDLKLYGTQDEVYLDLVAGRIDAAFADSIAISDGFLKIRARTSPSSGATTTRRNTSASAPGLRFARARKTCATPSPRRSTRSARTGSTNRSTTSTSTLTSTADEAVRAPAGRRRSS